MTKSETKLLLGIGILILLTDILLMKYWVSSIEPYPFMSVGIKQHRLQIFGLNILIGIIVFFIRKRLSILFFVNAIVCYWIFSFFWNSWIENHPYSTTEFTFNIENRHFILSIDKNPNYFGIDEIISESKDSLITIGMNEKVGDSLMLTSIQETMYFFKDQLIGFSISPNEIELTKIEFHEINLTDRTVVGVWPDSLQIEEIKKEFGEDNFYTITDDIMWYNSQLLEVTDSLKIKYIHTNKRLVRIITRNDQYEINNDTSEIKWRYIYFNGEKTSEMDVFEIINLIKGEK